MKNLKLNSQGQLTFEKEISLLPYEDRPYKSYEFMTDIELEHFAGSDLIFDCECYPNYFITSFKHTKTGKITKFEIINNDTSNFNNRKLSWIMFNYRTIGFNSINYDTPMVWASYIYQDTYKLKEISNDIIVHQIRKNDLQKKHSFKIYETSKIDLVDVCPLKGSLKLYAARLHAARLQDLPYPDTKELTENEINIVRNYNFNDLELTQLTYEFNKDRLDLRATMGIEYQEDLMSKSDAQIAEAVLTKEVRKLTGKWPRRPEIAEGTTYKYDVPHYIQFKTPELQKLLYNVRTADFIVDHNGKIILPPKLDADVKLGKAIYRFGIGGLHSSEKNTAHTSNDKFMLVDRDVASYYPRIITNLRLYPIGMGPDFLAAYEQIIQQRLRAKKEAARIKKEIEEIEKQLRELDNG